MGIINRDVRNISRRKVRALLVIIALGFSTAIMISIPAGVLANQKQTNSLSSNLSETITQTGESINQTLTQIDCSLSPAFSGFGFRPPDSSSSIPSQLPNQGSSPGGNCGGFDPSQFICQSPSNGNVLLFSCTPSQVNLVV